VNARTARPFDSRGVRAIVLPFTHFRELTGARRTALAGTITIGVGSLSVIPDFGWLEASQLLVAVSALRVIARSLETAPFPLPFHDGTLLAAGGIWTSFVTVANALDGADTGTCLIVLAGCTALGLAGLRVRARGEHYWFE
jgi:hypothetical protein